MNLFLEKDFSENNKKQVTFFIVIYEGYFRISFVFGDKAVNSILASDVSDESKRSLMEARKYHEGRGLSFEVHDNKHLDDIQKLILIKVG
jgi:hypothetical protein